MPISRALTPSSGEASLFWPQGTRTIASRQRVRMPNLSVSTVSNSSANRSSPVLFPAARGGEGGAGGSNNAALVALNDEGSRSVSPIKKGTLAHPSDYEDPDEVRDFSTVKRVKLRPSRAIIPLPKENKRVLATMEPVHSLFGGTSVKHLNSWPALPRALLSSSQAKERPALPDEADGAHASMSVALKNVRDFIDDEMRLVPQYDRAARLRVYQEAFAMLVDEFQSFGPLMREIRAAYEERLSELDETCQAFLLGDSHVQLEKEKLLGLQDHVITSLEKEMKSIDALRVRAMDSEETRIRSEAELNRQIAELRAEIEDLKHQLLVERTVRLEHEDHVATMSRLMHEAKDLAEASTTRLQDVESHLVAENERLYRQVSLLKREEETNRIRHDEALLVADTKYQKLLATCVDAEKLAEMRAQMEKVGRNNVILFKRNKWLEEQNRDLSAKVAAAAAAGQAQQAVVQREEPADDASDET